jgi:hypothetical protein
VSWQPWQQQTSICSVRPAAAAGTCNRHKPDLEAPRIGIGGKQLHVGGTV